MRTEHKWTPLPETRGGKMKTEKRTEFSSDGLIYFNRGKKNHIHLEKGGKEEKTLGEELENVIRKRMVHIRRN